MKTIVLVLGIALLAIGIAGFVPQWNPGGQLFGRFPMDDLMSALFAATGAVGILIGLAGRRDLTPPPNPAGRDLRPWV